jgi:RNA polymerase sigma-70 factor (ECF subfamily)
VIDWQAIVADHGPSVWRTVYRLVSHHEDALDCYQEAFLKASRYAQAHPVFNWGALLRQIATGRALDCLRRRYQAAARTAPIEAAAGCLTGDLSPGAQAELQETMEQLRKALAKLPTQQAEVFCLREIELMSTAEVAALLNATPDDVATWLHRAKRKLREALATYDHRSEVQR